MSSPYVTIIILNFNGAGLTIDCANSVLRSRYTNYDILIVDNGSTDTSFFQIKKAFRKNSKIKIIRSDRNRFFTGGFNFGAKHAKGENIILLSNDIIVDPQWINELVEVQNGNKKYLVQPKILLYAKNKTLDNVGGKIIFGIGFAIGRWQKDTGQYNSTRQLDYISATTFMVNRKFFLSLGGYDESFESHYEDVDISLRARKKGALCFCAWKSIIYHKLSITVRKEQSPERLLFFSRRNRLRSIMKNYSFFHIILILIPQLALYFLLIIQDFLSFKSTRTTVTIKAIKASVNMERFVEN